MSEATTRSVAVCLLLAALLSGCASSREATAIDIAIAHVRTNLPVLDLTQPIRPDAPTQSYFEFYGLAPSNTPHHFGTFASGAHQIAAHVFVPEHSRGTVVLVHGYYDHAGIWRHLLERLLTERYTLAILELPGHGLSSGARSTIGDFAEYKASISTFIARCKRELNTPLHIVAHSMGAGVTADDLLRGGAQHIDGQIVFLAPLIRPAHEWISTPGRALARPFTDSVTRVFRKNSSDEAFLDFVKSDPLHDRRLPLSFGRAMRKWYRRMPDQPSSERALLIIQGEDDSTVAWQYNLRFMRTKFPNATHVHIPKAGHQLVNESIPIRGMVFERIMAYLAGGAQARDDRKP